MKTIKNPELSLQRKQLFAVCLLVLFSLEGFSSNKLSELHHVIVNTDSHHHFLLIITALFLMLATWRFFANRSEQRGSRKILTLRSNLRRLRLRRELFERTLNSGGKWNTRNGMELVERNVKIIGRDELAQLKFEAKDVLEDNDQMKSRMSKLITAMRLGNSAKSKVKIYFKDSSDKKCIETTVWYADSNYVTLKGGLVLPVNSIYHINL